MTFTFRLIPEILLSFPTKRVIRPFPFPRESRGTHGSRVNSNELLTSSLARTNHGDALLGNGRTLKLRPHQQLHGRGRRHVLFPLYREPAEQLPLSPAAAAAAASAGDSSMHHAPDNATIANTARVL